MKALVLAALAAFSSFAPAGASRDARAELTADTATRVAMVDAGRLGSASLGGLNTGGHWNATPQQTDTGVDFDSLAPEVDTGTLVIACGAVALMLSRPLSRALRRREQERRAAALASTLGHSPRA